MKSLSAATAALLMFAVTAVCEEIPVRVQLTTTQGVVLLELDADRAPRTVENFLSYVRSGFYDGTIFHRVIPGFMIQAGGLTEDMARKSTADPVVNEADKGLKNRRGTVAMARTQAPHSATAQFFINTVDNPFLDHRDRTDSGWGYCVFGRVLEGMEVVDRIAQVPTANRAGRRDVPVSAVVIQSARVIAPSEGKITP